MLRQTRRKPPAALTSAVCPPTPVPRELRLAAQAAETRPRNVFSDVLGRPKAGQQRADTGQQSRDGLKFHRALCENLTDAAS